jgi:hypothetical protein
VDGSRLDRSLWLSIAQEAVHVRYASLGINRGRRTNPITSEITRGIVRRSIIVEGLGIVLLPVENSMSSDYGRFFRF